MKNFIILSVCCFIIGFSSCKKNDSAVAAELPQPVDTSFNINAATLLKQGSFTGNMSYTVSGVVKLYSYQNKKYLYLENYNGSSGPDLRVYLSTNLQASQFVSLGRIQANTGSQLYLIATPPDFTQYNKVLIWCQQFSVLFGSSSLN